MPSFKGFSTVGRVSSYTLSDVDLIKQDLMNEFQTRRGERLMRPEIGSYIHEYLLDPSDSVTESKIVEDVTRIVSRDPRVTLINTNVISLDGSIQIEVELEIYGATTPEMLYLEFERNSL